MPKFRPGQPRYMRQPRVGDGLHFNGEPPWPVLEVHEHGRRIMVQPRVGPPRELVRAERGWWLIAVAPVTT